MIAKDGARYAATGGWGFEGFKRDSRTERLVKDDAAKACFGCHQSRAAHDYVFGEARD